MEMPKDYESCEGITGDYEKIEAGGYICKIVNAKVEKSQAGNEMLVLELDIAEGEHEGYFQRRYEESKKGNTDPGRQAKWSNNAIHRIMILDKEGKCNRYFKGFGTIIEESNTGYKWTGDENTLKNKVLGAIFREEEYEKNNGEIGTSCKVNSIRTVKAIKEGKYNVPELKKLDRGETYEFDTTTSDIDDLPF